MESPQKCGRAIPERVEQRQRIGHQRCKTVAAGRGVGCTMAALIVAQDAERSFQVVGLRVPHMEIGGERIAEDEPGRAVRALDGAIVGGSASSGRQRDLTPGQRPGANQAEADLKRK